MTNHQYEKKVDSLSDYISIEAACSAVLGDALFCRIEKEAGLCRCVVDAMKLNKFPHNHKVTKTLNKWAGKI